MAIATDRELISRTKESARALNVAARWVNSNRPLRLSDDFLFELFVLFELILDLKKQYRIKYLEGKGNKINQFPRSPALKQDRPRFEVYDTNGNILWQICPGTKISDIHGRERAPDISFQIATSPDNPQYKHVILIWDAKYRTNSDHRITDAELSEFARMIEVFLLRKSPKPSIQFSKLANLQAHCLFTNGLDTTEPDAERNRLDLKEVYHFYPDQTFVVRPN
jgi:hypothetical protein